MSTGREHPVYHQALRRFLLDGDSRAEVAAAARHDRGRRAQPRAPRQGRLIAYMREEVWNYSSSREELTDELGRLATLL